MPAAALADKIKTLHKGRNGTADPSYISASMNTSWDPSASLAKRGFFASIPLPGQSKLIAGGRCYPATRRRLQLAGSR